MKSAWPLVGLLLMVTFAGCLGADEPDDPAPVEEEAVPREGDLGTPAPVAAPPTVPERAHVVVAGIDTGINPYNLEFRDHSDEAYVHPSEYIPGYPPETPALWLNLDEEDYTTAVLSDCDVWQNVTGGKMYWIPGTRIIGAYSTSLQDDIPCREDALPGVILDRGGHGTMISSRAAGETYSLCPTCKLVFVQGFSAENMVWAAEKEWIDIQTNSWGDLPHSWLVDRAGVGLPVVIGANSRDAVIEAASKQAVFVAGGNGLAGFFGVTGHPAYFDNIAGPDGVIMVGGHDNGRYAPWTMTLPHVVADANAHPGAEHEEIDRGTDTSGGGTSGATPFVAGAFAQMVLELRERMCDYGTGVRDGNLVWGGPGCEAPDNGPLDDGFLSLAEAKTVLYRTANPRPVEEQPWDGPLCGPEGACPGLYTTTPIKFEAIPGEAPLYYYVGYGQVGAGTLPISISAAMGEIPVPSRPVEDQFYGFDTMLRQTLDG